MPKLPVCILMAALAGAALGQEFEVVSVKPNNSGSGSSHTRSDNGMLTGVNVSLKNLVLMAYGMKDYQVEGPDWLSSERFDIAAKFPEALPKDRDQRDAAFQSMMQKMLEARFKLSAHRDHKNFAVYGLVVGKNGIKFKQVPDSDSHNSGSDNNHYKGTCIHMTTFAEFLSRRMDFPVIDMTGLTGYYDMTLDWVPEPKPSNESKGDAPVFADAPTGVTLPVALQEQLGLKLETRKAPIEILIVDHAEKIPTEN